MSPRVTIVVRTRNRPRFLERALRSVTSQSLPDYELVVVNDAGERSIVEDAVGALPEEVRARTLIVHNERSDGREAALESGMSASRCEFFAVHDDDDSWDPEFLARTVAYLDDHPEHAGVAVRCDVVHEVMEGEEPVETRREVLASDIASWSLIETLVMNYVPPISQLTRREAADRIGHWDGSLQTQADWDFNIRLLATSPVGFINGPALAHWHHRSTTHGNVGNSIVVDAQQHRTDNAAIRDRYARHSDGVDRLPHDLGLMLVNAEYYRRLHEQIDDLVRAQEAASRETTEGMLRLQQTAAAHEQSIEVLHRSLGQVLTMVKDLHSVIDHHAQALRRQTQAGHTVRTAVRWARQRLHRG